MQILSQEPWNPRRGEASPEKMAPILRKMIGLFLWSVALCLLCYGLESAFSALELQKASAMFETLGFCLFLIAMLSGLMFILVDLILTLFNQDRK